MPKPNGKKSLQRFLGMMNYLNQFCPALSSVVSPSHNLTHNEVPFDWSAIHSAAYVKATESITSAPWLAFFDVTKPVDASNSGLGGALLQPDNAGKLKPVSFMSGQFKPNEVLRARIEKEGLAICAAHTKWDLWLYGKSVTVHTDHQPLEIIFKMPLAKAPKRLQKLTLRLQRYKPNVVYKEGISLVLADTLSRAPLTVLNSATPSDFEVFRVEMKGTMEQPNLGSISKTTKELQITTSTDPSMFELTLTCLISTVWPKTKHDMPGSVLPDWSL